jgi:protein-S-isoprenylcysteine O-methyltransferase Ste14
MPDDETPAPTRAATGRSTGSLKAATGPLTMPADTAEPAAADPAEATPAPGTSAAADTLPPDAPRLEPVAHLPSAPRGLSTRIAETVIFLFAIVGAVAVGLGISNYLGLHPYVYAYLITYAAFRIADLLVREESMLGVDSLHFARRVMNELPVLLVFAAAPLERSYYSGDAPNWLAGLGILIELIGLWLVLGSRIQLGFYSAGGAADVPRQIVRNGLYRFIRHPTYIGEFLVLFAWPFEWAAPLTMIVVIVWGGYVMNRRIKEEEAEMLAYHGDEYAAYMRVTDAVFPNVW